MYTYHIGVDGSEQGTELCDTGFEDTLPNHDSEKYLPIVDIPFSTSLLCLFLGPTDNCQITSDRISPFPSTATCLMVIHCPRQSWNHRFP